MDYCFAECRVLKFQQSHFLSGFLHSYSQLTSRVTSISENEMNMYKDYIQKQQQNTPGKIFQT